MTRVELATAARNAAHTVEMRYERLHSKRPTERNLRAYAAAVERSNETIRELVAAYQAQLAAQAVQP